MAITTAPGVLRGKSRAIYSKQAHLNWRIVFCEQSVADQAFYNWWSNYPINVESKLVAERWKQRLTSHPVELLLVDIHIIELKLTPDKLIQFTLHRRKEFWAIFSELEKFNISVLLAGGLQQIPQDDFWN